MATLVRTLPYSLQLWSVATKRVQNLLQCRMDGFLLLNSHAVSGEGRVRAKHKSSKYKEKCHYLFTQHISFVSAGIMFANYVYISYLAVSRN